MVSQASIEWLDVDGRARQSLGTSSAAIYSMVARALTERRVGGTLVDVGCGEGSLLQFIRHLFSDYTGVDAVRYEGFPGGAKFEQTNLDDNHVPLADGLADVVAAIEIIEHLENPRAFMRELVRLAKPGGWVVVTTPNQLSLLSLLTLIFKQRFSAFQDVHYPAHISALLEVDLKRIAAECGLTEISIAYSLQGRLVRTSGHYPETLSRRFPRSLSDNLLMIGRKTFE
ncbi:MAG TPA: class I SAM-dependent methyltransferase [Pyrinomonadaceae bacterium]|nr:class I SAM-dependent methyltransferase [Pyrinomonadaceae bacterium]